MSRRLRVAVVTTNENNGGAAKAAIDLANACAEYVDIQVWSQDDTYRSMSSDWKAVFIRWFFQSKRKFARLLSVFESKDGLYRSYSIFRSCVPESVNKWKPDIIHLHWICGEYISVEDLVRFQAPLVWTLHDSWPFSGSEHHPLIKEDGCLVYHYRKSKWISISRLMLNRKLNAWNRLNICFICPTEWIRDEARKSPIGNSHQLEVVANGVDTSIFEKSVDRRREIREMLQISNHEKVILVGSLSNQGDPIKGHDLLSQALNDLSREQSGLVLITLGETVAFHAAGIRVISIPKIDSKRDMAGLYNCTDATCVPSRIETHSMMAAESICTGTPVAAFATAGNPYVVRHKKTGFLAKPFDPRELSRAINYCLERKRFRRSDFIEEKSRLSLDSAASRYFQIYTEIYSAKQGGDIQDRDELGLSID